MNAGAGTGIALGALCGAGWLLVVAGLPVRRAPSLRLRVEPYLGGVPRTRGRWPGSVLRSIGTSVGTRLGSGRVVAERLAVLEPFPDGADDLAQHRAEQVLWSCAGTALAVCLAWFVLDGSPVAVLAAMLVGAIAGALARGELLARAVRTRRAEVVADLPAVAELLALSVGAGENVAAALERVAAGHGPLCAGLRRALGRVRTGTPLVEALGELATRWGVAPFSRFVDGVAIAVEAGSPLAEVLRAQAADAREAERRRLVEAGGRREVQMMVPVVFGVLPVTVLFAVYPGLAQLQLGG